MMEEGIDRFSSDRIDANSEQIGPLIDRYVENSACRSMGLLEFGMGTGRHAEKSVCRPFGISSIRYVGRSLCRYVENYVCRSVGISENRICPSVGMPKIRDVLQSVHRNSLCRSVGTYVVNSVRRSVGMSKIRDVLLLLCRKYVGR